MKRKRAKLLHLGTDMAMLAVIAGINHCLKGKSMPMVKRNLTERQLNRNLSIVNVVYHALGLFYND